MGLESESITDETNKDLVGFVYEKSNRFSAAWKFLKDANRINLEEISGMDYAVAKTLLLLNYPLAYALAFTSIKYSPEILGYRF